MGCRLKHGDVVVGVTDANYFIVQSLQGLGDFFFAVLLAQNIVSDTYVEFAGPLMEKLGHPTLFCNTLSIADDGSISGYNLRQKDGKKKVALALKTLNYEVIAIGDSYNDITMLKAADHAILYRPPLNVKEEYTDFPTVVDYDELQERLLQLMNHGNVE